MSNEMQTSDAQTSQADFENNLTESAHPAPQSFTPNQIKKMAEWAVEKGSLTIEEANKELMAQKIEPIEAPDESLSPTAREIDHHFPPAKPHQFKLPTLGSEENPLNSNELHSMNNAVRGWLSDARFTKEIGSYVAQEVSKTEVILGKLNDEEKAAWRSKQKAMLDKVWGKDSNAKINMAKQLVRELDKMRPGLVEILESTGAGDNAMVIAQLAMQAERLYKRRYS